MRKFLLYFLFFICIGIFVLSSHTSKAWTWNDWVDYLGQLQTRDDVPSAWKTKINTFFQHENDYASVASGYSNYYFDMSAGDPTIWYWNSPITVTQVNTNINYAPIFFQTIYINDCKWYNRIYQSGTNRNTFNRYPGLIEVPENIEVQFDNNMWFQNKYEQGFTYDPVGVTAVNYNGYQGLLAKKVNSSMITLGTLTKPTEAYKYYRFNLLDENANKIGYLDWNTDNDYFNSQNISAFLPPLTIWIERRIIYLNQVYTLVIYAADEPINNSNTNIDDSQVYTYIFLPQNAVISNGTITNPGSGDNYNLQDATNDLINNLYDNNSGDSPGIVQKIYNDLFTLDSGDVTEIYDNLKDHFTSGDTPLITFTAFLDVLGQEPGDFIIEWEPIPINLTIAGGQSFISGDFISGDSINFSALARENEVLATCRFWINTILSFSVITILTFESYRIILKALGVATDLYNEADQDEQTTLTESESSGTITNPTTGEVRPQNIRKTRTITTRRRF